MVRPPLGDVTAPANAAARPDEVLEPAPPPALRSGLCPPQKIAFGHDSDETAFLVDHGQAADVPLQHDADGLPYGGIRLDRYDGRRHYVLGFHGGPPFRFLES
jgi:hypothetical protein